MLGSLRARYLTWLCACMSCGEPDAQVVAREALPEAPEAESGAVARPRGRVSVIGGKLVSDIGTPLRGLVLPVDVGWTPAEFDTVARIAEATGLNTLHVYLENATHATGTLESVGDALVSMAAQAGLYVIIAVGGGVENGSFSIEKVRSFWSHYAQRYADSTHVLFEIQNNPELTCAEPVQSATIELEREAYTLIRSLAPDSHVILLSTSSVPQPQVLLDAVERLSDVVDWSNASLATHSDIPCLSLDGYEGLFGALEQRGVAVTMSQLPLEGWEPILAECEALGVGWMHQRWFQGTAALSDFREQHSSSGLSWCPDLGTFPEDASQCRTP